VYCNYSYGIKTTLFMVVNADCSCICCSCDDFHGDSFHVPRTVCILPDITPHTPLITSLVASGPPRRGREPSLGDETRRPFKRFPDGDIATKIAWRFEPTCLILVQFELIGT
jgi:hypothetical protein